MAREPVIWRGAVSMDASIAGLLARDNADVARTEAFQGHRSQHHSMNATVQRAESARTATPNTARRGQLPSAPSLDMPSVGSQASAAAASCCAMPPRILRRGEALSKESSLTPPAISIAAALASSVAVQALLPGREAAATAGALELKVNTGDALATGAAEDVCRRHRDFRLLIGGGRHRGFTCNDGVCRKAWPSCRSGAMTRGARARRPTYKVAPQYAAVAEVAMLASEGMDQPTAASSSTPPPTHPNTSPAGGGRRIWVKQARPGPCSQIAAEPSSRDAGQETVASRSASKSVYHRSLLLECLFEMKQRDWPQHDSIAKRQLLLMVDAKNTTSTQTAKSRGRSQPRTPRSHSVTWQVPLKSDIDTNDERRGLEPDFYKPPLRRAVSSGPSHQPRQESQHRHCDASTERSRYAVCRNPSWRVPTQTKAVHLQPSGACADDYDIAQPDICKSTKLRAASCSAAHAATKSERDDSDVGANSTKKPATLRREVRSLLNKISPENQDQILSQLLALPIRSAEDLWTVCTLIVDKALSDPFYSEVYVRAISRLCENHATLPVDSRGATCGEGQSDTASGDSSKASSGPSLEQESAAEFEGCTSFKSMALQCCGRVFQKFFGSAQILDDDVEEACVSEAALKSRHRARAYMRFVGYLLRHGMLPESMFEAFLDRLLNAPKDTNSLWPPKAWIECACELLYTVGKELVKTTRGKAVMKLYVQKLSQWKACQRSVDPVPWVEVAKLDGFAPDYVYPLRTRFMIQDCVEAHLKGWPASMTEKLVPSRAMSVRSYSRSRC